MKATLEHDGCISCGICVATCPEVFRIGDDGIAEVYAEVSAAAASSAAEARDSCPVSVITLE